jgi:predicted kinase
MKKENLKILILVGIPASGKSTWSADFVRRNSDWVRVNRDDFRKMLKNAQVCEPKVEDMITDMMKVSITKCLSRKMNVIVDNTNLKAKYINDLVDTFKYSADIDYRIFDISVDKAIERDNNRDAKVGEGVIKKMFKDYKNLIDSFTFQPVKKTERPHLIPDFKSKLPHAVIFDIDGTLALMGKRGPFDWDKVDRDDVNLIVAEQINFHKSAGRTIIIVSGRDESCRKLTEEWFEFYNISFDHFFMRPENDFRKDTLIKKEIYQQRILNRFNVLAVYDDRLQVLNTWYELGVFTFCVNQGLHEF